MTEVMNKNRTELIILDGVEYRAVDTHGEMPYVIVRTRSAGVFAGRLKSRDGTEVVLMDARRLWYWVGAASLSQLAMEGTTKPEDCKFPCIVRRVILTEVIEILNTTAKARESIKNVSVWSV